ncbi:unnamed protein product [Blepharisma stoltei]|uniref:FHA domain-containing protein n=1 Tax=Blepharisma stoltei TaxID=1481888 RepID=A0AAU9KA17_9CILI|nr:unnamed protein product [Blepharisma stoltei]
MQKSRLFSTLEPSSNQNNNQHIVSLYNKLKSIKIPNYPLQESRLHSIASQTLRFVHSFPVYIERLLLFSEHITNIGLTFENNPEDGYKILDYFTKHFIDCFCSQICQTLVCEDIGLSPLIQDQNIPISDLLRKAMMQKLARLIWKEINTVNLEQAAIKLLGYLEIYGFFKTGYLKELVTYILSDNSDHPEACIPGLEDFCFIFFGEYQSFNAYRILNSVYSLIESMKYRIEKNSDFKPNLALTVMAAPNELIFLQVGQQIIIANNKDKTKRVTAFGKYIDGENINKVNFDPIWSYFSQIHMCIVNLDDGFYCVDTSYSDKNEFYRSIVWKRLSPNHPIALQPGMIIRLGKIQSSQIFEVIYINKSEITIRWNKGELHGLETKIRLTERNFIIGRSVERDDIILNNDEISRKHAQFEWIGGKIYLKDLESRNFTYFGLKRRSQIDHQEFSAFEKINNDDIFSINDYKFHAQFQD